MAVAQSSNDIDDKSFFFGKINSIADIDQLKSGVANNNLQAMMLLADVYFKGTFVEKDTAAAIKLLQTLIKNTDNSSNPADQRRSNAVMSRMFSIYHSPYFKQHSAELFSWTLAEAKSGNVKAMLNAGNMYREGIAVEKDSTEGMKWYTKAAEKNDAGAMALLGVIYDNGVGVAKDSVLALQWYERAAKSGSPEAMNSLGLKYRKGRWVKRDYKKAFELFEKSANAGNIFGMTNCGLMYEFGKGTTKDEETAAKWYLKVTDKSLKTEAIYRLGIFFEKGKGSIKQNDAAAMNCYKKAGPNAYCRIGNMYENGKGVPADLLEAGKWYKKAADTNIAVGMYWLGHWYEITGDKANANEWFQKANDALTKYIAKSIDDDGAMFTLAIMYENGNGVEKNIQQAINIYKEAADLGNEDAEAKLKELVH